jgi:hypothetical protein
MRERSFEARRNIDPKLVEAYLEANGEAPDDWVESAEGGAVDSELWSQVSPAQRQAAREALDRTLSERKATVLDADGNLRWD